ncbi:MAG: metallophosphoesterase [Syntrophobacterales bacterium]|jgi:predicted MPP superfamily phosphohydrolase|nr:metallophosphoesterase [Syntrophobacterales bacterium]
MDDFQWLHFSDLHFSPNDGFDTLLARRQLISFLREEKLPCKYMFITGDIANKTSYKGAKEAVKELISASGVPADNVFWAAGNHDIHRSLLRKTIIRGFRDLENASDKFEKFMKDKECKKALTNIGMQKYHTQHKKILGRALTTDQIADVHVLHDLPDLNLIVLNTCLASCDDQDEGRLLIAEPGLLKVFEDIDTHKPTIVIGHHGLKFFRQEQQEKLGQLFDNNGVGCYLCGHAHELGWDGIKYSGRDIFQFTAGIGAVNKSESKSVFLCGSYSCTDGKVHITPYSYHENGNWAEDYEILRRLDENNKFDIFVPDKGSEHSGAPEQNNINSPESYVSSKAHYEKLLKGRFSDTEFDEKLSAGTLPIMLEATGGEPETLYDTLKNHGGNFIFIGEGGTGKTTSLLKIWEGWLNAKSELPLYVPLNDYNIKAQENFISDYIKQNYIIDLDKTSGPVILLLDGFNEISGDPYPVIREIKELTVPARKGIRVVLASRNNFIMAYGLKEKGFAGYDIKPLTPENIQEFWGKAQKNNPDLRDIDLPKEWEARLSTPMMLTLFANTCAVRTRVEGHGFPFVPPNTAGEPPKPPKTAGELIYNYLLCQLAKLVTNNQREDLYAAYVALFQVAPYVAWKMETAGLFSMDIDKCEDLIAEFLDKTKSSIRTSADRFLRKIARHYQFKLKWEDEDTTVDQLLNVLTHQFYLLTEDTGRYTFRHQHFRDFLSALHIDNALAGVLDKPSDFVIPEEIRERVLPPYVAEMLGGYYGDYMNCEGFEVGTHLHDLLDRLRGLDYTQTGYAVNNVVGIWRQSRGGHIIGEDLSRLDLTHVAMNGVYFYSDSAATRFDGAHLSKATLLPQGHSGSVHSAVYSADGQRILSASDDKTIREWDRETGECLRVFERHSDWVNSAVYSADGQRILSASRDNTIREWDRETGESLWSIPHYNGVNIIGCSFKGCKYSSNDLKELVKVYGGKV